MCKVTKMCARMYRNYCAVRTNLGPTNPGPAWCPRSLTSRAYRAGERLHGHRRQARRPLGPAASTVRHSTSTVSPNHPSPNSLRDYANLPLTLCGRNQHPNDIHRNEKDLGWHLEMPLEF